MLIAMTVAIHLALFGAGVGLGWLGCYLRREWVIGSHRRCAICGGTGCYNEIAAEAARLEQAGRFR